MSSGSGRRREGGRHAHGSWGRARSVTHPRMACSRDGGKLSDRERREARSAGSSSRPEEGGRHGGGGLRWRRREGEAGPTATSHARPGRGGATRTRGRMRRGGGGTMREPDLQRRRLYAPRRPPSPGSHRRWVNDGELQAGRSGGRGRERRGRRGQRWGRGHGGEPGATPPLVCSGREEATRCFGVDR